MQEEDAQQGIHTELMWQVRAGVYFYYVESPLSWDCCIGYLAHEELCEDELPRLEDSFEVWTLDELLAAIDEQEDPRDFANAVLRAGLGAPINADRRLVDRICRAAQHPEPIVRQVALRATVYPEWPQFRTLLRQAMRTDPDEQVREMAEMILASYDRVNVPEE